MSGSASGLFMNVTGCTWTPSGGSVVNLTEITEADVDRGGEMKPWYADGATFAKAMKQVRLTRSLTLMGGNLAQLSAIPSNTPGTLVVVINDLNNGTSTGAMTLTLSNAVLANNPFKGQQSEYGTGSITFNAFSTDGTTDPLVITLAS